MSSGGATRRRTALACAAVSVWVLAAGCALGPDESDEATASPWQEWITPDASCPVTLPMSPGRYPEALRAQEGKDSWYGDGPLWVDLAGFYDAARIDDTVRAEHAWWTVDQAGRSTAQAGPPRVRATRLDGPGREVATVGAHGGDDRPWWPSVLTFPEPGCWLVTGTLGDAVVRVVVKAR